LQQEVGLRFDIIGKHRDHHCKQLALQRGQHTVAVSTAGRAYTAIIAAWISLRFVEMSR
jgi:hypothetical protein